MIGPAGFMAGPKARPEPSDPCEWDPEHDHPAFAHEHAHASAVFVLGRGAWRLCASCAALPRFLRYKLRRPIERRAAP